MARGMAGKRDLSMFAVVMYVMVVSAAVRMALPIFSQAPLNDGGLFYSMTVDLQGSGYALPFYTSYNAAAIPFAYPPLAFYLTGLLSSLLHVPVLDIIRLLPSFISVLSIPAFYLLAREMLASKAQVALAVVIFAFIPRVADWLIMGGGITRAPGFLFALLAIHQFHRLFFSKNERAIVPAIIFSTLTVYTHPEAAVEAALSAVIFYLFSDRSLKGLGRAALMGVSVVALSAPWWATVIARHGVATLLAPFTAAGQDSLDLPGRIFSLFGFEFTDELFLTIIAILGLLGLAVAVIRKQYFLPVWITALFLLEPRGGQLYMMVPHAMLAAISLEVLILPGLRGLATGGHRDPGPPAPDNEWLTRLLDGTIARSVLGYLFLYSIMSMALVALLLAQKYTLKAPDLEAFQWVRSHTPAGGHFALLTGESVLRDASSEWFPALAERRSLATVFGYEWVNDGRFGQRGRDYETLQACANQDASCLDEWSREVNQTIDYVYIRKYVEDRPVNPALARYLSLSSEYVQVYETSAVVIFRHIRSNE